MGFLQDVLAIIYVRQFLYRIAQFADLTGLIIGLIYYPPLARDAPQRVFWLVWIKGGSNSVEKKEMILKFAYYAPLSCIGRI